MKLIKLSDEEVAILTFALEDYEDSVRQSSSEAEDNGDPCYTESFQQRVERMLTKCRREFDKRGLDQERFRVQPNSTRAL